MPLTEIKLRISLLTGSVLVVVLFLLIAELCVRLFMPHVKLYGTDRALVRDPAFGTADGWVPDATGTSFSAPVHINHRGFRDIGGPSTADSSLLLIGDSVTFGVGVEADSTFAGMLQRAHPTLRVINTGMIGYSLTDYHQLVDYLLPRDSTTWYAIVCYSLNDFQDSLAENMVQPTLWSLRTFFREHSKLYVWIKATFFDRSEVYFLYDYAFYAQPSQYLPHVLTQLSGLVTKLRDAGVVCTVLILPYEYQLRMNEQRFLIPQQVISRYLHDQNVPFIDAFPNFKAAGYSSKKFFLLGDHMHLAPLGHTIVFNTLQSALFHK